MNEKKMNFNNKRWKTKEYHKRKYNKCNEMVSKRKKIWNTRKLLHTVQQNNTPYKIATQREENTKREDGKKNFEEWIMTVLIDWNML